MSLRHWTLVILAISLVWGGIKIRQWNEASSVIERMSATSDEATIVRIEERKETSGEKPHRRTTRYYRPVVEFEDSDSWIHTARSLHESRNGSLHLKGDSVSVIYDPYAPESGCVIAGEEEEARKEAKGNLISGIAVIAAGIGFTALGEGMWAIQEKAEKRAATEGQDDGSDG